MKKIKLQIKSKPRGKGWPKWIPPEKRMRHNERDYGIEGSEPMTDSKWKKVKWPEFFIIVPDLDTKEQLKAAFEYLHDNKHIDPDFIPVNCLIHSYCDPEECAYDPFIVDFDKFQHMKQIYCHHKKDALSQNLAAVGLLRE